MPERVGVRLQPPRVGRAAAARDEQVDRPTRIAQRVDDVAASRTRAPATPRDTSSARSSTSSRMRTPGRAAGERRIGERRAVAEHVRLPVPVGRERVAVASGPSVRELAVRAPRTVGQRRAAGCDAQRVVEERARRGDAGFGEPAIGEQRTEVGTPDAGHVVARRRHRKVARRGAGDHREPAVERRVRRRAAPSMPSAPACASMSDDADRRTPGASPSSLRPLLRRGSPRRSPGLRTSVPMRTKPSAARSPRPIAAKYDSSHRSLVPEVCPLAHGAAQRAVVAAGGAPRQEVGKVEPVRGASPRLRQVLA